MKECELCSYLAMMYCESDQASLCWDCDEKVHGANFLVARHTRILLCHVCQSLTPWKASGLKLCHTLSVCERCVTNCNSREHDRCAEEQEEIHCRIEDEEEDDDDVAEDEDGGYSGGEDDEDDVDDEDGKNQVVSWSCTPPPLVASSSSSEGESTSRFGGGGGGGVSLLKRTRVETDIDSDEDIGCCSSQRNYNTISTALTLRAPGDDEVTSFRQLKLPRTTEVNHSATVEKNHEETKSNSMAIISSLKRFQQSAISGVNVSAAIIGIQKLSRDPRALHLYLH